MNLFMIRAPINADTTELVAVDLRGVDTPQHLTTADHDALEEISRLCVVSLRSHLKNGEKGRLLYLLYFRILYIALWRGVCKALFGSQLLNFREVFTVQK
jgi:hypothetical protein